MHIVVKHVVLPALAPAAVVGLYFTPVLLFGCVNRGWMALAVVLVSAVAACVTVGIALHTKTRGHPTSNWWMISTLILTLPIVLVLGPLG